MKLTLFIFIFLSFNAWSDSVAEYSGPIFKTDQLSQCESELKAVIDRVEATDRIKVIEEGCIELADKSYQLKFSYIQSPYNRIEKFVRSASTDQECRTFVSAAPRAFASAGHQFINSYCTYGRVIVDYLTEAETSIRNLNVNFSFETALDCEKSITGIKTQIAFYKMSDILWSCDLVKSFDGNKGFIPTLNVSSNYSTQIKFLKGKKVAKNNICFENRDEVARSFEAGKTKILGLFCANKTYTKEAFEVMAYVEQAALDLVRSYEGMTYSSHSTCEIQLARAKANLESKHINVLYSFCDVHGQSYQPVIHYAQSLPSITYRR